MSTKYLKLAQAAYEASDFERAVELYEFAILERPELDLVYRFNLNRARIKLRVHSKVTTSSPARLPSLIYLDDLYREVARFSPTPHYEALPDVQPLVSVVMTAHNVAEYI